MKIFQKIKHSITKKIFLLIVLSIGASFAVSLLVIKKLENAYANYVYEAKRDLLNSSMAGIEDKLAAYENGTYQFITNDRIQVYASALKEAYDIFAEMEREKMQESVGENLPLILEKQSKANQVKTSSLVEILKELDTILVSGYKVDAGYFVDLSGKVYNGYGASKYRISDKNLEIILNNAMKNNGSAGCGIIQITEKNGELCNKIYLSRILRERKNLSMEYCGTVIYLIAPEELASALSSSQEVESLQKTIYQSDGNAILLEDRLESKENEQEKLVNRLALKKVMCELPDQEQKIIIMRYYSGQTQVQTAKCLGISQVQVSRIEKRVLKKMRALLEM